MLQLIGETADAKWLISLLGLSELDQPEEIQLAVLDAIQQMPSADISGVMTNYSAMKPSVQSKAREVFFSRKNWAREFLLNVDSGKFKASEVPLDQLQKVPLLNDKQLNELVRKNWGNIGRGTPEEKLAAIRRFNNDLRAFPGDSKNGHAVFLKSCAVCHELFGEGQKVGPELTHANRTDKDFLLTSIVDPNVVIRKEFLNFNIETKDGRVLNGLIIEQNGNSVTLVGSKNEKTTLNRDQMVSIQESSVSLMPEGLMHALTPQERRDLFAYLQSTL
ncbi:MAG: c-type cytochrome [Verrucomicrobiota bacterium]